MDVNEIINLIDLPTNEDKALIQKAYDYACQVHKDQKRFSGEPFFNHPFQTAKILAELKMDAITIAAGLLHTVLKVNVMTEEEIKKEFGDEILFLISGVTRLNKLKYHGAEKHIESLRKLFVASAQDIRVLIIKLADRLHNMRTIEFLPEEKQKRIAVETLEIFAPLAYRLGIRRLTRELEDLSFPYVYPKEYNNVKKLMKLKKEETLPKLEKFMKSVKKTLAEEGIINIQTDFRQKGLYSLSKKIISKGGDIENIYDILAIRIFTDNVANCYRILGIIHNKWRPMPGRIKDYIAVPKTNGYQSIHTTVFTGDGAVIEIQIRTHEMHRQAEYGIASYIVYKDKKNKENKSMGWFDQFLPKTLSFFLKNTTESMQKNVPDWLKELAEANKTTANKELNEDFKADFFSQRIFVFTPKGDVIDLPVGASAIDFAYAIHSDIGNHIAMVMINHKIAPLGTELKNGDQVEILTKKTSKPNCKWLKYTKTNMAKRLIRSALGMKNE